MYDLIDRPVRDLPLFERSVLIMTRRWTHALSMAGTASVQIGGTRFCNVMSLLHEMSEIILVIRPPCHEAVDDSEAVIVNLWRLVRAGSLKHARQAAKALVGDASDAMVRAIAHAVPTL